MTDFEFFCVAAGGAAGALCRYAATMLCARFVRHFPLGTLLVNVAGSLLMGLLAGYGERCGTFPLPVLFCGAGFLGALTTFSTFAMDTFATFRDGHPTKAAFNILLNVSLSFSGTAFGLFLLVG